MRTSASLLCAKSPLLSEGLLTPAGLARHSEASRELALRVLSFISDEVNAPLELGDGVPYPRAPFTFLPTRAEQSAP